MIMAITFSKLLYRSKISYMSVENFVTYTTCKYGCTNVLFIQLNITIFWHPCMAALSSWPQYLRWGRVATQYFPLKLFFVHLVWYSRLSHKSLVVFSGMYSESKISMKLLLYSHLTNYSCINANVAARELRWKREEDWSGDNALWLNHSIIPARP